MKSKASLLKRILCIGLVFTMALAVPLTSHAAQGSVYGYANLNLVWTTSATGASASLRSGTNAMLQVIVEGDVYSGNIKIDSFSGTGYNDYGVIATCAADRLKGTIKNGYAGGIRGLSQGLSATIYY